MKPLPEEQLRDLGFGSVVATESRQRLLNRDGTFNVKRTGLPLWYSLSLYHWLLSLSWSSFFAVVIAIYLFANLLFAIGYLLCGPDALQGIADQHFQSPLLRAFFFSVQTIATIGYGGIVPVGTAANVLVTMESVTGLLGFTLITGILFARFSRPTAHIVFSKHAVIAPYRGFTAFEFRIANERKNEIIELEAQILFSRMEHYEGRAIRQFYPLPLERSKVSFFPLSWTVVHPIDENSPLFRLTDGDLRSADAEFLVLLTGIDDTFSQTVHTRSSYKDDEIVWNARFVDIFKRPVDSGPLEIDVARVHEFERL